eukprot:783565_1
MTYQTHWDFAYICALYEKPSLDVAWSNKIQYHSMARCIHRRKNIEAIVVCRTIFQSSQSKNRCCVQLKTFPPEVQQEIKSLKKHRLSQVKMLRYKCLISIEGNDVASNLNIEDIMRCNKAKK